MTLLSTPFAVTAQSKIDVSSEFSFQIECFLKKSLASGSLEPSEIQYVHFLLDEGAKLALNVLATSLHKASKTTTDH